MLTHINPTYNLGTSSSVVQYVYKGIIESLLQITYYRLGIIFSVCLCAHSQ